MWTVKRFMTHERQSLAKDSEEYWKVHHLFAQLTHTDETTVTDVLLNGDRLKGSFLYLGTSVSAFGHSLKVLGVDGCLLKTQHGGVVLVATAIDGNGNIFSVAVGTAGRSVLTPGPGSSSASVPPSILATGTESSFWVTWKRG